MHRPGTPGTSHREGGHARRVCAESAAPVARRKGRNPPAVAFRVPPRQGGGHPHRKHRVSLREHRRVSSERESCERPRRRALRVRPVPERHRRGGAPHDLRKTLSRRSSGGGALEATESVSEQVVPRRARAARAGALRKHAVRSAPVPVPAKTMGVRGVAVPAAAKHALRVVPRPSDARAERLEKAERQRRRRVPHPRGDGRDRADRGPGSAPVARGAARRSSWCG